VELKRARVGERIIAAMMGAPGNPAPVAATGALPASSVDDGSDPGVPMDGSRIVWSLLGSRRSSSAYFQTDCQCEGKHGTRDPFQRHARVGRDEPQSGAPARHYRLRPHAVNAVFVLHLSEARVPNIRLVKALVKNGEREVAVLNKVYSTGAAGDHDIPFAIVRLKSELYRVIPKQPLDRGEFAFVDISAANQAALAIYDFGVN
jgi:hypothetical protein